jgi:hypothetical protein
MENPMPIAFKNKPKSKFASRQDRLSEITLLNDDTKNGLQGNKKKIN